MYRPERPDQSQRRPRNQASARFRSISARYFFASRTPANGSPGCSCSHAGRESTSRGSFVFAASAPGKNYDDPQASIDVYVAAFEDTLKSFDEHGASDEFPRLLSQLVNRGAEAGFGDKQVTALIDLLDR